MKDNIIIALIAVVCIVVIPWGVVAMLDAPANQQRVLLDNERRAMRRATEHQVTYNTAAAIGATEQACYEAKQVLEWTIKAHDIEAAKTSQSLVRLACGEGS